jgi:hypothetical protein
MTSSMRRALVSCMALMLAVAAVGGAVSMAEQHTNRQISPVGESEAGVVTVGVVIGAFAVGHAACEYGYTCDGASAEEQAKVDALETKTAIHRQALTQRQNNDNFHQQVDNELQGTKSVARMEGKNAYIKALNNGTAEAVARAEAREAVADYYSTRQKMMIQQWNVTAVSANSSRFVAENTSQMSGGFVGAGEPSTLLISGGDNSYGGSQYMTANFSGTGPVQDVALVNGTTHPTETFNWDISFTDEGASQVNQREYGQINNGRFYVKGAYTNENARDTLTIDFVRVKAPNDNYDSVRYVNMSAWEQRWSEIEQMNNEVQSDVDTFINQTYAEYQQGEISNSDLVDPYLGAREYDPQNSSSWALRSTTAMGITPPEEVGNVDTMTVTTDGTTLTGLLMSGGEHTIASDGTYNASNQSGQQYVYNPDTGQMSEITGQYSVGEIRTPDGSTREEVTYQNPESGVTSMDQFKQRMQTLNNYSAALNARQQRLRQAGAGGGDWTEQFSVGGIPGAVGLLAAIFIGLLMVGVVTRS